jgi:hypothetical protein
MPSRLRGLRMSTPRDPDSTKADAQHQAVIEIARSRLSKSGFVAGVAQW